ADLLQHARAICMHAKPLHGWQDLVSQGRNRLRVLALLARPFCDLAREDRAVSLVPRALVVRERRAWGAAALSPDSTARTPLRFTGAVRRRGDGAALQPVPLLRPGDWLVRQPRSDRAAGRRPCVPVRAQPHALDRSAWGSRSTRLGRGSSTCGRTP